jgi:hypothetical protein
MFANEPPPRPYLWTPTNGAIFRTPVCGVGIAGCAGCPVAMVCRRPSSDAVSEFTADTWRAANALSRHMESLVLRQLHLTWPQWELLRYVCEEAVASVRAAASRLALHEADLVVEAVALARRGLLYMPAARLSGYTIVAATEQALDLAPGAQERIAAVESRLLCPLPQELVWAVGAVLHHAEVRARSTSRGCLCEPLLSKKA